MSRTWQSCLARRGPFGATLWMAFWFTLVPLASAVAADQTYVIKRGDTLYDIARKYGISPGELAERNGLGKNAHIYPGRRLLIPSHGGHEEPGRAETAGLPAVVQRAIDRAPVKPGRWKYIVVHHSGVNAGTVKGMDRYHREVRHMENGLAYHFVIGNGNGMEDGQVVAARRWTRQLDGGHLASETQNRSAIGICLVGDFDHRTATANQMRSLRALTKALMERCRLPVSAVKTHREINVIGTRCPGSRFNAKTFRDSL